MNADQIRVSVIIPTYNRAFMLTETLASLLDQDYSKHFFEVIIVDNNSKDETERSVRSFVDKHKNDLNIKYVIEKRQGDVYARHTGACHAAGETLLFTDDDATFDQNWISEVVRIFNTFSVGAVGTRIRIKWDRQTASWVHHFEPLLGSISFGEGYTIKETGMFINNGSLAIKKEYYRLVKGNNPGQVKDLLIGDAEIGLCRKLHAERIPIGFTDDTTMWHHQFADKNGRLQDLLRRVKNNGIAEAYTDIYVCSINDRKHIAKTLLVSFFMIFVLVLTFSKRKFYGSVLRFNQVKYRWIYFRKFQTDSVIKAMLDYPDWKFDEFYSGGELLINSTISLP